MNLTYLGNPGLYRFWCRLNSYPCWVDLIVQERERLSQQARVEALLLEGLDSGEPTEASDDWWEQKRSSLGAQLPFE